MKAISIRQQWTWLVVHGHKDIEKPLLATEATRHDMTLESFPDDITEAMSVCALRFDGYKYEDSLGPTEATGERLQAMGEPVIKTLILHDKMNANFGAFFCLQRFLHKWGGEHFTKYSDEHIAYDFLFLHLYRSEIPREFAHEEYMLKWASQFQSRREEIAGFVRCTFKRKGRGPKMHMPIL